MSTPLATVTSDAARTRAHRASRHRSEIEHIFSVDVEEYFQVSAFEKAVPSSRWERLPSRLRPGVDRLLELLARHDAFATFFVLGWTARRHPDVIRGIVAAGHEIASHGWSHRRVNTLEPEEFRTELRDSKRLLEDLSGTSVVGFRAPSFSLTPGSEWAFDVLVEEGYTYDSSIFPIRRPGYGSPGACPIPHEVQRAAGRLLELPLATLATGPLRLPAAGGAYLRHLPYWVTRKGLQAAARFGVPGMFYVHPWELDPSQPRLPVGRLTRIRHYRGLGTMASRIERLLGEFDFTSVRRSTHPALRAAWAREDARVKTSTNGSNA
jgi:polysaccharide deacetylase family protein (PEP-CTERM system associated)